jgi:hypothetical protein
MYFLADNGTAIHNICFQMKYRRDNTRQDYEAKFGHFLINMIFFLIEFFPYINYIS